MAAQGHEFPAISPSQRSYTPGTFPTSEFQSLNGSVTTLQYGRRTVDSKLQLTFQNIPDAEAYEILDNYEKANGGRDATTGERDWVILPFSGAGPLKGIKDDDLRKQIAEQYSGSQPKLRYRYAQPPTITSTFVGRSTVQVELRGYLEGANSLD